jgi:hypothetical protein
LAGAAAVLGRGDVGFHHLGVDVVAADLFELAEPEAAAREVEVLLSLRVTVAGEEDVGRLAAHVEGAHDVAGREVNDADGAGEPVDDPRRRRVRALGSITAPAPSCLRRAPES